MRDKKIIISLIESFISVKIEANTLEDALRDCEFSDAEDAKNFYHQLLNSTSNKDVRDILIALEESDEKVTESINRYDRDGYNMHSQCLELLFGFSKGK